jgi:uncharacterized membrane protein YgdD (TMEM256/DUF423 family)
MILIVISRDPEVCGDRLKVHVVHGLVYFKVSVTSEALSVTVRPAGYSFVLGAFAAMGTTSFRVCEHRQL